MGSKNVMDLYEQEFNKILELRRQRSKIYGDFWANDPIEAKVWLCWEKAQRAAFITKNNKDLRNSYETLEDTLRDMINYAMFGLVIVSKMKKENKDGVFVEERE